LAAAVAQGGANQFRIFTSEEKRIDDWSYACILSAREWFYQHKTGDEAYNKQLMTRIIRGDKQAGAQSAVVSYFIKNKEWSLVKKGIKWFDVHTDQQWIIYLDCYRASVTDPSNPNLPMLDRLMAAMRKIPDVGREVEVLGTALEKGLLDLSWEDYTPDPRHPGEVIENPRNLEVIKQFLGSIKAPDRARATYKQNIMEGQGIDELGTCKSLWLMVGRMHLQIQRVAMAKTTLIGLGMRVIQEGEVRREEVGNRVSSQGGGGDRGQGSKATPDHGLTCAMCGRTGHGSKVCLYYRHPDANTANIPWKDSMPGKAWAAKGVKVLPAERTLRGDPVAPAGRENQGHVRQPANGRGAGRGRNPRRH
jgi:hypothetical protein